MRISGVYTITNLKTRTVYVGASRKIGSRWQEHKSTLKHGKHRSSELQADWDAIGADQFIFAIAACLPADATRDDLIVAERAVIARLQNDGTNLYNAVSNMDKEKLKTERTRAALSLRALGELSGVSYVTLQRIEVGLATAHLSTVRKIADALGVKPIDLMSEREDDLTS